MRLNRFFLIVAFFLLGISASAQGTVDLRIVEQGGAGSHLAIVSSHAQFPGYTLYRPLNLTVAKEKTTLPLVLFANGGCYNSSVPFEKFLNEIASFGYIVIAIGPYTPDTDYVPDEAMEQTSPQQLTKAIDIMEMCVKNPSSEFFNMVDIDKIAVMGQSCGGLQALAVSADPRITTTVCLNTGVLNDSGSSPSGMIVTKADLKSLHSPVLYLTGGAEDIAYPNAKDDFDRIANVFVAWGNCPVGHDGTYSDPFGGSFAQIVTQWLQWQLKGMKWERKIFTGEECICVYSGWNMVQKNIDKLTL